MRLKYGLLCLSLYGMGVGLAHADTWSDLTAAARAGQTLNVEGQYVRQTGSSLSAFTVYRLRQGHNIVERRIAADGTPRELIKNRNSVHFYTVNPRGLLQAKMDSIRFFPAVLPLDTQVLKNSYIASEDAEGRIAGRNCRWVWLIPNDTNRYTQGFCLDNQSHLPLTQVYKSGGRTTEISSFAHVSLNNPDAAYIKPDGRLTVTDALQLPPELNRNHLKNNTIQDTYISDLPAGFFILSSQDMRSSPNGGGRHYVIGDGLVYISLFVEPADPSVRMTSRTGTVSGALSMATAVSGNFKITAIGDLPPRGLRNLVQNIQIK